MEKETKLSLGLSILIGVITALLIIVILPLNQEPKLLDEGRDYVKSVDKFCYSIINENTEEPHNITYKRGWGYAYRDCMLSNLNIKEHTAICDTTGSSRKGTASMIHEQNADICECETYVSEPHWMVVCDG